MTDLRFAARMLRKSPGFTLTAALSLALGIGANTAIFSLIDALLVRMLPVRDPQQLVELFILIEGRRIDSFSYPVVRILSERASMFSGLCGFSGAAFNAGPPGETTRIPGAWVSGAYHETLGVQPALGRMLTRDDDQPGAPPVAVLSYSHWEGNYARDPGVVGRSILLEGHPVTIVGVSAPGFNGANVGQVADITVALGALPQVTPESGARLAANSQWLRILARPKLGISLTQAKAGLAVLWPQLVESAVPPTMNPLSRKVLLASALDVSPGGTGWSGLRDSSDGRYWFDDGGRRGAHHRLRQCGEPAAGSCGGAATRNRDPARRRGGPWAADPATVDRERPAVRDRCSRRNPVRILRQPVPASIDFDRQAGYDRARLAPEPESSRIHQPGIAGDRYSLRPGAGLSCDRRARTICFPRPVGAGAGDHTSRSRFCYS